MTVRQWNAISFLLAFAVLVPAPADADPVLPARTGSVIDAANIIGPVSERTIASNASNLQAMAGVELVVVTLLGLQGYSIEQWGRALGNGWKVGGDSARGVLLIVAPNDRAVRIEVGDGLPISDSTASSIIDNLIIPQFRSGEMTEGILAGVYAIARAAMGKALPQVERDVEAPRHSPPQANRDINVPRHPPRDTDWSTAWNLLIIVAAIMLVAFHRWKAGTPLFSSYDSDDDSEWHGSGSSRSRSWSSMRSSSSRSSRSFSSGRSSGGFSGRGASGRW